MEKQFTASEVHERERFEEWYTTHACNYSRDPIASRDCSLQWESWKAALAAHSAQAQPRETMTPRELAKLIERGENWKMVEEPSQAQPPAARVSDEMVERARSAFVKADDGSTGITDAIRAALLAAQNPNG